MRYLITGASGFIGSRLVKTLCERGADVRVLLRPTSARRNLPAGGFEVSVGDLLDTESLRRAVRGVDVVVHLAAATTARDRAGYFRVNLAGTRNLARAIAEDCPELSRFVLISSLAAAGPAPSPLPRVEGDAERPVSAYGRSKRGGERVLRRLQERVPVTILRPSIVYGPGDRALLPLFKLARLGVALRVVRSGHCAETLYSTIHVDDLCCVIIAAARPEAGLVASGEVFYVAGDEVVTHESLILTMGRVLGRRQRWVPVPFWALRGVARGSSVMSVLTGRTADLNPDKILEIAEPYWICSGAKARERFGTSNAYDLESGFLNAVDWYRSKGWL